MKELIQTGIVALLLVVAIIVVITTRGTDSMDWKINFDIKTEEEWSYDIVPNQYNGEYKNSKGNSMFILMGQNTDGTYRVYFIHVGAATFGQSNKYVVHRTDDAQLDATGSFVFTTENNVNLKFSINDTDIYVTANYSVGDSSIEGHYIKQKSISRFAMSEVQIFK